MGLAQTPGCAPAPHTARVLWDHFHEVPVWQGIAEDGSLIELYAALPTEPGGPATWTIVQTAHGMSCERANGPDWLIPALPNMEGPET